LLVNASSLTIGYDASWRLSDRPSGWRLCRHSRYERRALSTFLCASARGICFCSWLISQPWWCLLFKTRVVSTPARGKWMRASFENPLRGRAIPWIRPAPGLCAPFREPRCAESRAVSADASISGWWGKDGPNSRPTWVWTLRPQVAGGTACCSGERSGNWAAGDRCPEELRASRAQHRSRFYPRRKYFCHPAAPEPPPVIWREEPWGDVFARTAASSVSDILFTTTPSSAPQLAHRCSEPSGVTASHKKQRKKFAITKLAQRFKNSQITTWVQAPRRTGRVSNRASGRVPHATVGCRVKSASSDISGIVTEHWMYLSRSPAGPSWPAFTRKRFDMYLKRLSWRLVKSGACEPGAAGKADCRVQIAEGLNPTKELSMRASIDRKTLILALVCVALPVAQGCTKKAEEPSQTRPVTAPGSSTTGPSNTSGGLGGNPAGGTPGGAATAGPSDGTGSGSGTSGTNEQGTAAIRMGSDVSVPPAPPATENKK